MIVRHPCDQIASQLLGWQKHKFPNKPLDATIANTEQARRRGLSPAEFADMTIVDELAYSG